MARSKTIANKVYKYVHNQDVYIQTNLTGRVHHETWLEIEDNGKIIVKCNQEEGYAWDGCSPKWNFIDLIWGTPDGRLDFNTDKQITYYASMIHDVLYQYKSTIPLSRKEVDVIFRINLRESRFLLSSTYFFFVRLFGGLYGKWKTSKFQDNIVVSEFSWLNK